MRKFVLLISLLLLIISMTACARDDEVRQITFDGNGCTVTGMTELLPGEHVLLIIDTTDSFHRFYLDYLDGKTLQDLVDLQPSPGEYFPKPEFAHHVVKNKYENDESSGGRLSTYAFDFPGEYAALFYQNNPTKLWLCGPINILEQSSE